MQIVTTREFRAHQKKYFELAETEKVYVTRKNARPIVISIADDDVHTPNETTTNGILRNITDIVVTLRGKTIWSEQLHCRMHFHK